MKNPKSKIPSWVKHITQEENKIKGFYAENRFLSNF